MDDGPDDFRQWRLLHEIDSYVVLDYLPEAPYGQSHVLAGHRTFGAAISFRATGGQEAATLAWREETKPLNPAVAPAFRCGRAPFSPLSDPCLNRSKRPLQWPDLAEGRLKPRSPMTQQPRQTFFPCRLRRHSSRDKKAFLSGPAPSGCAVDRLRPADRHRGRNGADSNTETETYNGDHRHLQEDRLERIHRRNRHPQRPGQERAHRPRPAPPARTPPATGFWSAAPRSAPPGPSAPTRAATIWASSLTIRASSPRSTPTSSTTRTRTPTR